MQSLQIMLTLSALFQDFCVLGVSIMSARYIKTVFCSPTVRVCKFVWRHISATEQDTLSGHNLHSVVVLLNHGTSTVQYTLYCAKGLYPMLCILQFQLFRSPCYYHYWYLNTDQVLYWVICSTMSCEHSVTCSAIKVMARCHCVTHCVQSMINPF